MKNVSMMRGIDSLLDSKSPHIDDFCLQMYESLGYKYHVSYRGEWVTLKELGERVKWYARMEDTEIYFMGGSPRDRKYRTGSPLDLCKDTLYMMIVKGKAGYYAGFLDWLAESQDRQTAVPV